MKLATINRDERKSMEYTILLILTDGEIHDMEDTINNLIKSAKLPLSIVIIGIGSEFEWCHFAMRFHLHFLYLTLKLEMIAPWDGSNSA